MIKIIHITPHLGGGVGKALLTLISASNKFKYQHSIICLEQPEKKIFLESLLKLGTQIYLNPPKNKLNELIEAARVDGASMVHIYRSIILPLSIPGFVVVLIWQFTSAWNDFLFAIFLTGGSPKLSVATTALNFITGSGNQVYYGNNMTASLIVSIPTLLVYMFLGRYFLRGLLSGSLKG